VVLTQRPPSIAGWRQWHPALRRPIDAEPAIGSSLSWRRTVNVLGRVSVSPGVATEKWAESSPVDQHVFTADVANRVVRLEVVSAGERSDPSIGTRVAAPRRQVGEPPGWIIRARMLRLRLTGVAAASPVNASLGLCLRGKARDRVSPDGRWSRRTPSRGGVGTTDRAGGSIRCRRATLVPGIVARGSGTADADRPFFVGANGWFTPVRVRGP